MIPLDWQRILIDLALVGTAFALAFPIAYERHDRRRPAGIRTFPIVAIASCAFVLLGIRGFPDDSGAQARIIQGLMTGMGFIGGGAILKDTGDHGHVRGIATAASIWNTGAIGAAVAFRRFEIALTLCIVNYVILRWLRPAVDGAGSED